MEEHQFHQGGCVAHLPAPHFNKENNRQSLESWLDMRAEQTGLLANCISLKTTFSVPASVIKALQMGEFCVVYFLYIGVWWG